MRYGVTMFVTDVSIGVVELAQAVEERGLDSLWLPEHTHIPVTPSPTHPSGGPLPEKYKRSLDPLVALAAAASATTALRLRTGVLLAAQREGARSPGVRARSPRGPWPRVRGSVWSHRRLPRCATRRAATDDGCAVR
mgnify:CR=1 FL=1